MGIGAGILIAAVGAVLAYAVTAELAGVDVQVIGVIMMIAGLAIALIAGIVSATGRRVVAYDDQAVATQRPTRVVEEQAGPTDSARI